MYKVEWTEKKNDQDYKGGYGIGPRFHFTDAKVIVETDKLIILEKEVDDKEAAQEIANHIRSWFGKFDIKIKKIRGEKEGIVL